MWSIGRALVNTGLMKEERSERFSHSVSWKGFNYFLFRIKYQNQTCSIQRFWRISEKNRTTFSPLCAPSHITIIYTSVCSFQVFGHSFLAAYTLDFLACCFLRYYVVVGWVIVSGYIRTHLRDESFNSFLLWPFRLFLTYCFQKWCCDKPVCIARFSVCRIISFKVDLNGKKKKKRLLNDLRPKISGWRWLNSG